MPASIHHIKMVICVISNHPKTKTKKIGPHTRAQISISKKVQNSTHLQKRKRMGRRKGHKKDRRQMRDIHMVHKVGQDVVGKLLYYDWGTDTAETVKQFISTKKLDVIDVSNYNIIDSLCSTRHTVVLDGDEGNNFIFAKIAKTQCNECFGGKKGLNMIRKSFTSMKKVKPNQHRGKKTSGLSSSYKLFGHRKDQLGKNNGEYVFKSSSNISKHDIDNISSIYCNLSYNMEKAARRIGNALYETGVYESIQANSNVPSVGVSNSFHTQSKEEKKSLATALAVGENYWSLSHTDNDFYFTALSVLSQKSEDNDNILYHFIFPSYNIMVPMTSGDVLLFNPRITHSCSNPSLPDSYIFSSYVSKKTVLTAEATTDNQRNKIN